MQTASFVRHFISPSVACPALQYFFSHIISETARFSENLLDTNCVILFSLQHTSETAQSETNSARCRQICGEKNRKISNFIKSVLWEPSWSMWTTREQADTTKLTAAVRNSANAPDNPTKQSQHYKSFVSFTSCVNTGLSLSQTHHTHTHTTHTHTYRPLYTQLNTATHIHVTYRHSQIYTLNTPQDH